MKKLLYIFLFVPLALFGQELDSCYSVNDIYQEVEDSNPPVTLDLLSGWNIIGYSCVESKDALEVLSPISDKILLAKNNAGSVYMPEFGFNGIGDLLPNQGYQIKMSETVLDFEMCDYHINYHQVEGCTDCEAVNFNQWATTDDGSCTYNKCTDSSADNYNPDAGVDDGTCVIYGCLLSDFPNYNSEANNDDGSCDMNSLDVFGCTDESTLTYQDYATIDNGTCYYGPLPEIGDLILGGIVFYIDETGEHGLVAALEDLGSFEWGCHGTDINGNNSSVSPELDGIGTGLQNTLEIVAGCSETPIAASEALAYESGGYSDWYIPSRDELKEMYNTVGNGGSEGDIGGFGNNWYWSSSEFYNITAWYVNFFDGGNTYFANKSSTSRVRVIRAF